MDPFFFLGFGLGKVDQMLPKQHYSKLVALEQKATIEFELEQRLRPTNLYDRYYIRLKKYNNTKTTGRLLLQLIKNTTETDLDYSKNWTTSGKLKVIQAPLNLGQFDYKHYLKTIGIYHQFEIDSFPTAVKNQKANFFLQSKAFAIKRLKKSRLNTATKQLLNALLLGEKTALDREAIEAFSQAGLAHLLAISGLHIGLLMLLFRVLWFPVRFLKNGELFQSVGVVLSLWLYAFFVGGTPSVLRTVTLFTSVQIGYLLQRKLPTAYLVLLSMAVLVFFSPRLILHLGFQLSYLAVFGILFIHSIFQLRIPFAPLRWFWNLTVVSLAAQIAVAPLSIYHFKQFPALFLLSNWVVLPLLGGFLYLGFASLIWLFIAPLPQIIIDALDVGVSQLNRFVLWINKLDAFFMNNLFMDEFSLVLSYFFLSSLLFWYYFRKEGGLYFCGILLLGLMYSLFVGIPQKKQGVWLAHRFGATVLIEHQNNQLRFYSNDTLTKEDFTVKHYQNYVGERSTEMLPLKNSYTINNAELVVVDGACVESFKPVSVRYLLLRNNPKVNLERLLKKHSIKVVLIDGSNSPYYIARWKESLTHEKIAFHVTAEQGAYEFNLENEE